MGLRARCFWPKTAKTADSRRSDLTGSVTLDPGTFRFRQLCGRPSPPPPPKTDKKNPTKATSGSFTAEELKAANKFVKTIGDAARVVELIDAMFGEINVVRCGSENVVVRQ